MAADSMTLVLLANSCKNNERCVAGKSLAHGRIGAWVRPVSARAGGELAAWERQLVSGAQPRVLDVVEMPLERPAPCGFQTENRRIASGARWIPHGRLPWSALPHLVDPCETLWINGCSSGGGCNDRVPALRVEALHSSLCLIGPLSITLRVGGGKVRASFQYRKVDYNLSVTDPTIKAAYASRPDGCYPVAEAYVCVSLAPVWNGYAYKLAAAIITPPEAA